MKTTKTKMLQWLIQAPMARLHQLWRLQVGHTPTRVLSQLPYPLH